MWKLAPLGCLLLASVHAEVAAVNGVKIYYEVHGQGQPVVLLHGGMHGIQSSFAQQFAPLALGHKVIAIEQMGHGHTPDVPGRALSYQAMAEDTAALLVKLGIANAVLIGWSDGGQIALRLAFTHPELVRRVVAAGVGLGAAPAVVKELGVPKDFPKLAANMFPQGFAEYHRISPDGPAHWAVIAQKGHQMWTKPSWGFDIADLAKIKRPVLIVAGDRDFVSIEESARIYRAIPGAKLFILPGTGHTTFQDRPNWFNPVLLDFLNQK